MVWLLAPLAYKALAWTGGIIAGGIAAVAIYEEASEMAQNAEEAAEGASGSDADCEDERVNKPPSGSKPIDKTEWSGDHQGIKEGIGAGPADNTKIDPDGNVWGENPDGSWTNHGPAGIFTGSGRPSGRKGKDRQRKW